MHLLRFVLGFIFPMAPNSIDVAFTRQFESEVHLAYQRMGSKLLNTVRRKTNVIGKSTTFQKIGKGTAGTKTRGGQVPILNLIHTNVEVTLLDRYGGEFIDKLDELKIEHDERAAVTASIAGALGRESDADIVAIGDTSSSNEGSKINDNFKELHLLLDQIRSTLVGTGHMKGSA